MSPDHVAWQTTIVAVAPPGTPPNWTLPGWTLTVAWRETAAHHCHDRMH